MPIYVYTRICTQYFFFCATQSVRASRGPSGRRLGLLDVARDLRRPAQHVLCADQPSFPEARRRRTAPGVRQSRVLASGFEQPSGRSRPAVHAGQRTRLAVRVADRKRNRPGAGEQGRQVYGTCCIQYLN